MAAKQNKKILIVLGPPGSGKGTQSDLLANKFGFFPWETSSIIGNIIEQSEEGEFVEISDKKYFFEEQKKLKERGLLWDSEFVLYFTRKMIKELALQGKGIVMSGSPRTLDEGQNILLLLEELYGKENIVMIYLNLNPETTLWRNTRRRECELATHSILYTEETKNLTICPLDGSKLIHREDDNAETIKTRLEEYKEKTLPLVDFFKKSEIKVAEVDAEQSVADVFKDILKVLK